MANHKGFYLYLDQYAPIAEMTLEQKGMLLDAMFAFHAGEDVSIPDPVVNMAFNFFRAAFEREEQKYSDICKKRSGAIRKRWDTKNTNVSDAIQTDTKNTNVSDAIQTIPNPEHEYKNINIYTPPVDYSGNEGHARSLERGTGGVDLEEPGLEFLELRQEYDQVRPEGPLDGFQEYKQLKASRDRTGSSRYPGNAKLICDFLKRKEIGFWNPGYEIGLARYLKSRLWEKEIKARASPATNAMSWSDREWEQTKAEFLASTGGGNG